MTVEVDYTLYLEGTSFRKYESEEELRGYQVIPNKYDSDSVILKKTKKMSRTYNNLSSFVASFENDVRQEECSDYFLHNAEVCIDKIHITFNLND
jgi:hypothetical protein